MHNEVHQFKDLFGSGGIKNTRGRGIILKEIEARNDHFNAETLYSVLNKKGTKVSRATIYRTLNLLERLHLIERLDVKEHCFYYEPISHKRDHGHLICEQCGTIIDFSWSSIDNLKSEVCKGGYFKPGNISIHIFGICKTCQKASKTKS
jgi:Fur family transcriptional regulator, ferric uptake regulator